MRAALISGLCVLAISGTALAAPVTVTFQQNVGGYSGTQDTYIMNLSGHRTTVRGGPGEPQLSLEVNQDVLMEFGGIFGMGVGQIPLGSTIVSATLTLIRQNSRTDTVHVHRMLTGWDEDAITWDNATLANALGGVQTDDLEAASAIASTTAVPVGSSGSKDIFDLTGLVQEWADGADNFGFLMQATGLAASGSATGLRYHTSDYTGISDDSLRPLLSVTFEEVPLPGGLALGAFALPALLRRRG